jgi:SNF2 family DNA or RNA helicase
MTPREPLYQHQQQALDFIGERKFYGLLMEQRTGKTAVEILDAARRFLRGEIDALLVCAPNGVQTNWVRKELPRHMPTDIPYKAVAMYGNPNKRDLQTIDELSVHDGSVVFRTLRILTISWDALITEVGFGCARSFCEAFSGRIKITGDESQRVKNPSTERSKAFHRLKKYAACRSIMSGTPILNSPFDAFSQFNFLDPGILETSSFSAFRAEYAELMPPGSAMMRHIQQRIGPNKPLPQIVARNHDGTPRWRNLQRLERLIAPHVFRMLRKDCLGLPEKMYSERYFRMTPKQRDAYNLLRDDLRIQLVGGDMTAISRIAAFTKLSQITSGYYVIPGTKDVHRFFKPEKNPRLMVLADEIETMTDADKPFLIWARFHEEIDDITTLLKKMKIKASQYHGRVPPKQRPEEIDKFQNGDVNVFLGQMHSGIGITLVRGKAEIYYSNNFSLEDRLQSEDRPEGIGQTEAVDVIDIMAEDSIDEVIADRLRMKKDLAAIITGDSRRAAELLENSFQASR